MPFFLLDNCINPPTTIVRNVGYQSKKKNTKDVWECIENIFHLTNITKKELILLHYYIYILYMQTYFTINLYIYVYALFLLAVKL